MSYESLTTRLTELTTAASMDAACERCKKTGWASCRKHGPPHEDLAAPAHEYAAVALALARISVHEGLCLSCRSDADTALDALQKALLP